MRGTVQLNRKGNDSVGSARSIKITNCISIHFLGP